MLSRGRTISDGPYVTHYDGGQKRTEGAYVDGVVNGPCMSWYPDGQKWYEYTY